MMGQHFSFKNNPDDSLWLSCHHWEGISSNSLWLLLIIFNSSSKTTELVLVAHLSGRPSSAGSQASERRLFGREPTSLRQPYIFGSQEPEGEKGCIHGCIFSLLGLLAKLAKSGRDRILQFRILSSSVPTTTS